MHRTELIPDLDIEVDTYFGRFIFCKVCKRWTWHDRVIRIKERNVWDKRLFCCVVCKTVVNWDGEKVDIEK
jgi:hypothetical protein